MIKESHGIHKRRLTLYIVSGGDYFNVDGPKSIISECLSKYFCLYYIIYKYHNFRKTFIIFFIVITI